MSTSDQAGHPIMIPISISAAGDNTIIAGLPQQWIYIHQILLIADGGANTITLKKNATNLSFVPMQANEGIILENTRPDYPYLFDIESGLPFIINLSAATSVKGHVIYSNRK